MSHSILNQTLGLIARWTLRFVIGTVILAEYARATDRGAENTSDGAFALYDLNTGFANTGIGYDSLRFLQGGYWNTAGGAQGVEQDVNRNSNSSIRFRALYS